MKIKKIVLLLSLVIVLLSLFYGIYIYAVNSGKVSGVYGNYFRGYKLDNEKELNTIRYCQLIEEKFYVELRVYFANNLYTPLNKSAPKYQSDIYEKIKDSTVYLESSSKEKILIENYDRGTFISFVSNEEIPPDVYTININLPDIGGVENYSIYLRKINEYRKIGRKIKLRYKMSCDKEVK